MSVNTNTHKRNSRSHGAVMHTWSSLWAPRQGRPLPERWGLEQNRYRDWRPAPHDTEHWPQGVHTDHWPSTGGCVFVCGGIEQEKYSTAWDNEVKENSYWWFFIACLYLFLLFSYLHIFINLINFMYGLFFAYFYCMLFILLFPVLHHYILFFNHKGYLHWLLLWPIHQAWKVKSGYEL